MKRGTWAVAALTVSSMSWWLSAAGPTARADDWPRFRGPNGAGIAETPFNAPLTEQNVLWKITLPGPGHSSPAVWHGRVYVTASDASTARRIILCLDGKSGKAIWKREFDSHTYRQLHKDNSYASATPAVDDVGVYVSWSTPESLTLMALDHDGKDLWQHDLGPFVSQHGSGGSPIVVDDLVILEADHEAPGSRVVAFDHKTGQQRWKLDRKSSDKAEMSTPCLFYPKDGPPQLILSSKGTGMTAVNPKTGATIWQVPDACVARTVGSAVVTDHMVVQACGDGVGPIHEMTAIRLKPANATLSQPEVAYHISDICPYVPTPVIKGDLMFMWGDNGIVTCINVNTGKTIWSERTSGQYYGSPVLAGDTLWAMNRRGKLVGIAAADHFKLVGELDLGEATQATPAVADGRMYLRTMTHLTCVANGTAKSASAAGGK